MLICGIKVTHDGGVALVEDGHLVFSAEMEKLANRERHARIEDLSVVFDLLRSHGYDPADLDHLVIDGWRKTDKIKMWGGQEISLPLAPYRRGILHTDLLKPYTFTSLDLTYESYPHYAGHVASAYCSSEFAREGADAYILCWDGAMFPFVYHYSPDARRLRAVGPPFYMLGDVYHTLAQGYPPFDDDVAWPHTLALPGKIMAYVSLGTPDKTAVQALHTVYQQAVATVLGTGDVPDDAAHELAGRRILERMRDRLSAPGASAEDMLASIHRFLTDIVVDGLVKVIDADGRRTPNLCLVGGCALNIKWNRAIRDSGIADTVWVPPFPNDAGSAIGAACCALLTHTTTPYLDWSVYSGPSLPTTETTPPGWTASPCTITELAHVLHHTGQPVVFLHGSAELGPRALGHRSILAPATDPTMKDTLNTIKEREPYRPVAPICLHENAPDVFDPGTPDPYMLFDHTVRPEWRHRIPAICHVDNTARLQTIHHTDEPTVHQLLTTYYQISGIPLLCNTSANHKGRGFFPDAHSAMEWGQIPRVWTNNTLYEKVGEVNDH